MIAQRLKLMALEIQSVVIEGGIDVEHEVTDDDGIVLRLSYERRHLVDVIVKYDDGFPISISSVTFNADGVRGSNSVYRDNVESALNFIATIYRRRKKLSRSENLWSHEAQSKLPAKLSGT